MSYLVDTDVVSELRKAGELRRGIEALNRRDRSGAASLNRWLHTLATGDARRMLVVDLRVAEEWGRMTVERLPTADALLAATARVHRLTVVTRNTKDLARTGVPCLNPFAGR